MNLYIRQENVFCVFPRVCEIKRFLCVYLYHLNTKKLRKDASQNRQIWQRTILYHGAKYIPGICNKQKFSIRIFTVYLCSSYAQCGMRTM